MNSFSPELGWGEAERLPEEIRVDSYGRSRVSFAVDGTGRAVFVWSQLAFRETMVHNHTWTYDFNANVWLETESPSASPQTDGHNMAYDVESQRAILFGVSRTDEDSSETWAYDLSGKKWTNMSPSEAPTHISPSNAIRSMAYDAESDRVILLGGWPRETWAYDYNNNTWTNLAPDSSPEDVSRYQMTYDADSDRIILLSGSFPRNTWAYDYNTNTWKHLNAEQTPYWVPAGPLVYDAESNRVVAIDSIGRAHAYNYNTDTWTTMDRRGPDPGLLSAGSASAVYDEESDRLLLFSGLETWAYDLNANTWTEVAWQDGSPTFRVAYQGPPVYDPGSDRILIFGTETRTIVHRSIWANHFTPTVGWAHTIEGPLFSRPFGSEPWIRHSIGIDEAGNTFVFLGEERGIAAAGYTPGAGWDTSHLLETEAKGFAWSAFSPFGNAIVLWEEVNNTEVVVRARQFIPGVGWGSQSLDPASTCLHPRSHLYECPVISHLVVSRTGHAVVLGHYDPSLNQEGTYAVIRHLAHGSWTPWTPLETWQADLGIDDRGRGLVVWETEGEIAVSRFLPGAGLLEPVRIGSGYWPRTAMHSSGDAVTIWGQKDGETSQLLASQFSAIDVEPPILTLTSPQDGLTTSEPTVTVTGLTEPGVNLIVGGLDVAVDHDGSFSVPIALSEGTNTITATATDAAQNRATVSLQVAYVSPIPQLEQRLQDAIQALGGSNAQVVLLIGLQGALVASILLSLESPARAAAKKSAPRCAPKPGG